MNRLTFAACLLVFATSALAQHKLPISFGKVTAKDFELPAGKLTDSSNAVVIADVGNTVFVGSNRGGFAIEFNRKMRARVNNAAGVDVADFEIYLYHEGSGEEEFRLKTAAAYNLVNGKVEVTELERKQIFKEKYSERLNRVKFSVAGVKPGSLIEVNYSIKSDFIFNLQPWTFQREYPTLWSEYEVGIPEYFNYVFLSQGHHPLADKSAKEERATYNLQFNANSSERQEQGYMTANVMNTRFLMKDIPAIKEEAFTTTLENHISKIEFQLNEIRYPNQPVKPMMGTWGLMAKSLYENPDFLLNVYSKNSWLDEELAPVLKGLTTNAEKARAIYNHLRKTYTCTNKYALYLRQPLKDVVKKKAGSVSELNLLLTAMLHHEGITAYAIILSTRSHGIANTMYPLINQYNYVICAALPDGGDIPDLLDASEPLLAYGKLHPRCYNGPARVITRDEAIAISIDANGLLEKSIKMLTVNTLAGGKWVGDYMAKLGETESHRMRTIMAESGEGSVQKAQKEGLPEDALQNDLQLDYLKVLDTPVTAKGKLDFSKMLEDDIIYLNPMPGGVFGSNPFNAPERVYPVEMPFAMDETFIANWQIPEGYVVEDMPKGTRVKLFEDAGFFEYMVQASANRIMLKCRLKIDQTNFVAEDYKQLKEFFNYVISKENEQIVLKKKASNPKP